MNKYFLILIVAVLPFTRFDVKAQSNFPASSWNNAVNLSSVLPANTYEASGLYWNDLKKLLFVVCDDGKLFILKYNSSANNFTLLSKIKGLGAPEGIMQVDDASDDFYTIDETEYKIRRFKLTPDFKDAKSTKHWSLLDFPSTMKKTGNDGPEGITFVPDAYLNRIKFVSSETQNVYHSAKGMKGLIFIANQNKGFVWVYDVNPHKKNDFVFVGKYKTAEDESCDLAFDKSTGLMYILHNIGANYLEVTDLETIHNKEKYKFNTIKEYNLSNPAVGSINVEGFAITPKFSNNKEVSAWLCRDVSTTSESADCIRWFHPFNSPGENIVKAKTTNQNNISNFEITTNKQNLTIHHTGSELNAFEVHIYTKSGREITNKRYAKFPISFTFNQKGTYIISITNRGIILFKKDILIN